VKAAVFLGTDKPQFGIWNFGLSFGSDEFGLSLSIHEERGLVVGQSGGMIQPTESARLNSKCA
jgi:hypothetical protein